MAVRSNTLPLYLFDILFQSLEIDHKPISKDWWMPHNPSRQAHWFRLVRFRSPLLTESLRFLFLGLLRCFSSPGALLVSYYYVQKRVPAYYHWRVSPFGNLWINAFVQLPRAFRRLRVLHRQLVPRHPSHTLTSLQTPLSKLSVKIECAIHNIYAAVKMLYQIRFRRVDRCASSPHWAGGEGT